MAALDPGQFVWDPISNKLHISRRMALRWGIAAGAGLATFGLVKPRQSDAGILGWFAATVFASAIAWVVNKFLDKAFPDDPKELKLTRVSHPTPSTSTFHNPFSEPWEIRNRAYHLPVRRVSAYRKAFGIREYLQLTDLNVDECAAIKWSYDEYGMLLLPTELRRPYSPHYEKNAFDKVCEKQRLQADPSDIRYVRGFDNEYGTETLGFAVAQGRRAQLLIV
jgi:hypothetical protein